MSIRDWISLLRESFKRWMSDEAPRLAASLSYYSLFSLAPLLLLVVAITGLVFGRDAAEGRIVDQLQDFIGKPSALAVQSMLKSAWHPLHGVWATVISIGTLLFGALGVMLELKRALNTVWRVQEPSGFKTLVRTRMVAIGLVLGLGFLFLISLLVSAILEILYKYMSLYLPFPIVFLQLINSALSLVVIAMSFGALFKYLPDRLISWKDVFGGAFFTAVLFTGGKYLLALYLGREAISSSYGAAGAIIILMLWVYYSALIFYFGAEFTALNAARRHPAWR